MKVPDHCIFMYFGAVVMGVGMRAGVTGEVGDMSVISKMSFKLI